MKKMIAVILLLCLCVVCVSCSNNEKQDAGKTDSESTQAQAAQAGNSGQTGSSGQGLAGDWTFDSQSGTDSSDGILKTWGRYGKWDETMSVTFYDDGTGYADAVIKQASETYNAPFTYTENREEKKLTITMEDGSSVEADYELREDGKVLAISANGKTILFRK